MVLSRDFLLKRGYCCKLGCVNCPYMNKKISYLLKTGNALCFELNHDEEISLMDRGTFKEIKCLVQEIQNVPRPFYVKFKDDDVKYCVIEFIKVKENQNNEFTN